MIKKQHKLKEMQYTIGEVEGERFSNSISVFTFPLFGVPVQISGRGFLAIRRFVKFENRATRHAKKLARALQQASDAARDASIYFYLDPIPQHYGKKKQAASEPPASTD